jgi:hypothetical protein
MKENKMRKKWMVYPEVALYDKIRICGNDAKNISSVTYLSYLYRVSWFTGPYVCV